MTALVRSLDEDQLDAYVPLSPAWRVRDVVAHLIGVCEDSLARNYPDFSDPKGQPEQARAREEWTEAQVDRRRGWPMNEMLERWDLLARELVTLLDQDPEHAGYDASVRAGAPFDLGCHLHDLRHALDDPGDRDAPTTAIAFGLGRGWLSMRLDKAKSPALRMRSPDREWVIGHQPVALTVAGDRFDLFRAISGRRSLEQLLALDWDADPTDRLDEIVPYPLPEKPVIE